MISQFSCHITYNNPHECLLKPNTGPTGEKKDVKKKVFPEGQ